MLFPLLLLALTVFNLIAMNTNWNIDLNTIYCTREIQTCTDTFDREKFLRAVDNYYTIWRLVIKQIGNSTDNANTKKLKEPFNYDYASAKTICALNQTSKIFYALSKKNVENHSIKHQDLSFTLFKIPVLFYTDSIDNSTNYKKIHPSWIQKAKSNGYTLDPMMLEK
ncbi:hypothetical protein IPH25_04935 [bacterium]|nr:MAG: hypothetical protein IPH25_04935 [bacterium]QQR62638.1 MAG: hypothetical protein IPH67_04455 [bacterium]